MASELPLRLVSYNCRGWNSGNILVCDLCDSFDLCFVQEHWLLDSQLDLLSFSPQFCSIGVSGMSDALLQGRPYGGCGIIYRKTLSDKVCPLSFTSKRLCAALLTISNKSILCVCVYFPTNYHDVDSSAAFLGMLGEIEGIMDQVSFDHLIIGGDFNVDLNVPSPRVTMFSDFIRDHILVCVDQLPASTISYTYFCETTCASSWIDHFVCDSDLALQMQKVGSLQYGSNLSDHLPLYVVFNLCYSSSPVSEPALHSRPGLHTNWDLVADQHVQHFYSLLTSNLPQLSDEIISCVDPCCKSHSDEITDFLHSFLDCISIASIEALPAKAHIHTCRMPGWNDKARELRNSANFWHWIWLEAGSPSAGVLTELKKKTKSRYKYEVRRLKRRKSFIMREKLAASFLRGNKKFFWKEVKRLHGKTRPTLNPVVDGIGDIQQISEVFCNKLAATLNKHNRFSFDPTTLELVDNDLRSCFISSEDVLKAFEHLKRGKRDDSNLESSHFILAAPVIAESLATFFTVIIITTWLSSSQTDRLCSGSCT